jgi:hypothetical protein
VCVAELDHNRIRDGDQLGKQLARFGYAAFLDERDARLPLTRADLY